MANKIRKRQETETHRTEEPAATFRQGGLSGARTSSVGFADTFPVRGEGMRGAQGAGNTGPYGAGTSSVGFADTFPVRGEGMRGAQGALAMTGAAMRGNGETVEPVGREQLVKWTETLGKYKAGKAHLERRIVAAENWWKLRNEIEEEKVSYQNVNDFRCKSGWLHNVIVSKHADAMEAYPEPNVLPREPGDRNEATMLSSIIPAILEQNKFERTYDRAMWQKLKAGTAAYRVSWDKEKLGGLGDISIETVNLLNLFWEPGVDDIQQSSMVFYTFLDDKEELQSRYPQLRDGGLKNNGFNMTKFVYDDTVDTANKATVIEAYYHRWEQGRRVLHYCMYVGDVVLYSTENEDARRRQAQHEELLRQAEILAATERAETSSVGFADTFPVRGEGMRGMRAAEGIGPYGEARTSDARPYGESGSTWPQGALARTGEGMPGMAAEEHWGLYDHGKFPFVLDPLYPIEGSPCGYGFVDLAANVQTQIDLLKGAFLKNTMVGATPRYFQRRDGSINEEEFLDLTKPIIHVNGNMGEDSLRSVGYQTLSGNYIQVLENTIHELRQVTGNTETATGSTSAGATAASAIAALQEASGKGSRDCTRGSYTAFADIVEMIVELIRQFYDAPRRFRIVGMNGAQSFVSYSNEHLRPQDQGFVGGVDLGMRRPVFDFKIAPQKRSSYTKLTQNEMALQFYSAGVFDPSRADLVLPMLNMMEFEGKDELTQKISQNAEMFRQLQMFRKLALALTAKYEPTRLQDLVAGIGAGAPGQAPQPTAAVPQADFEPNDEPTHVRRARERAASASQPNS